MDREIQFNSHWPSQSHIRSGQLLCVTFCFVIAVWIMNSSEIIALVYAKVGSHGRFFFHGSAVVSLSGLQNGHPILCGGVPKVMCIWEHFFVVQGQSSIACCAVFAGKKRLVYFNPCCVNSTIPVIGTNLYLSKIKAVRCYYMQICKSLTVLFCN